MISEIFLDSARVISHEPARFTFQGLLQVSGHEVLTVFCYESPLVHQSIANPAKTFFSKSTRSYLVAGARDTEVDVDPTCHVRHESH